MYESHLHIWMRFAVVATAVDASVLMLLLCQGVVTGEATDDTRGLVCSSSSLCLQYCSVRRPTPFTWLQMSLTSGSLHVRLGSGTGLRSLSAIESLVWSRLGMITLVYHKEYTKCLKLIELQKVSCKKIHESLTTARTLDIYNLDSSIHCYFRLLARQPARKKGCEAGRERGRRRKVIFLSSTLADKRLVRAGQAIEVCRIVAKWSGQGLAM